MWIPLSHDAGTKNLSSLGTDPSEIMNTKNMLYKRWRGRKGRGNLIYYLFHKFYKEKKRKWFHFFYLLNDLMVSSKLKCRGDKLIFNISFPLFPFRPSNDFINHILDMGLLSLKCLSYIDVSGLIKLRKYLAQQNE